jgi:cbb3-type cytochrome oxidase maturation protein
MDILGVWTLYGIVGVVVFSLAFLWAVRNRQFGDQERARYLPLEGLEPQDQEEPDQDRAPASGEGNGEP